MIDGIVIAKHVMLVALGVDAGGQKHVLGVREGATENAASCTALLTGLRERGLRTDHTVLVVIDGGKALAKAVRNVFGGNALVQRCQAHKARNVVDQLPEEMKPSVRQALREAYATSDHERARTLLTNLMRRLRDEHPGAAASLEEGLDETISAKKLRLPKKLERQLSTTNAIENLMGSVRELARRVKRWRGGGRMIVRWTVTAVADAATRFRRITGALDGMPQLMRALALHENSTAAVAPKMKVEHHVDPDSVAVARLLAGRDREGPRHRSESAGHGDRSTPREPATGGVIANSQPSGTCTSRSSVPKLLQSRAGARM
jgi:hypothetical protein